MIACAIRIFYVQGCSSFSLNLNTMQQSKVIISSNTHAHNNIILLGGTQCKRTGFLSWSTFQMTVKTPQAALERLACLDNGSATKL